MRKALSILSLFWVVQASAGTVCQRQADVRSEIETVTMKKCSRVTAADLAAIKEMEIYSDFSDPRSAAKLQPSDFAGLTGLQTLYVNGSTSVPGAFSELKALKSLELWSYQGSALPPHMFSGLEGLTHLSIENSPNLVSIEKFAFSDLLALQWLNIENIGHDTPRFDKDALRGLHNVETFFLKDRLASVPPELLSDLTQLTELELHTDTALEASTFATLTNLDDLVLEHPAHYQAGLLDSLTKMRMLVLSGQGLFPDHFFKANTALREFDLTARPYDLRNADRPQCLTCVNNDCMAPDHSN